MKLFVVVCVVGLVGVYGAAVPQDMEMMNEEDQAEEGPYPAAGYRPSRQFLLPNERRELLEPNDPRIYGYPDETPTTTEMATTTDTPTTTEDVPTTTLSPQSSQLNSAVAAPNPDDVEEVEATDAQRSPTQPEQADQPQQGVYYVLLPSGQLQRVEYLTRVDDVQRAKYTAQLRYENVQPITGPIYAYNPNSPFYQIVA